MLALLNRVSRKWLAGCSCIHARVRRFPLFLALLICSSPAAAQATTPSLVGNIQSESSPQHIFYFTKSGGGTFTVVNGSGCAAPFYIYLLPTQSGYKDLLATIMLAKALGKRVQFIGNCSGTDFFNTTYVVLFD